MTLSRPTLALALAAAVTALAPLPAVAQAYPLAPYTNETFGFSARLPLTSFVPTAPDTPTSLTLGEEGGEATIRVFAGEVPEGSTLAALREGLAADPGIREITYERAGESWFVISGFLDEQAQSGDDFIFYAKLMLSPDRRTFSAFEITFPGDQRPRYAAMVEAIEDNLTRPR